MATLFTRRHYLLIARTIATLYADAHGDLFTVATLDTVVEAFCTKLAADNPRFNLATFRAACYGQPQARRQNR